MQKQTIHFLLLAMLMCGTFFMGSSAVLAEEAKTEMAFDAKLKVIEDRTLMLHMVMKQLTHTYKKAQEDHVFMQKNGMPEKDIQRLERAFQKKIQKMINEAVKDIDNI